MTRANRFPWLALLGLWATLSVGLTAVFWRSAVTLDFYDPDDYLRLQQVRDLIAGQSWFDLTQYRLGTTAGLPMHWSRLADIPVLLFLVPLKPLIGQHWAEVVAVIGAPLLSLLALMIAVAAIVRRLLGHDLAPTMLACLLLLSAPSIVLQIHPARIDHHGWQIVFAALAVASLLQHDLRSSGIGTGIALALYLNISIEGLPFVVAAVGIVALLWALGQETGVRLTSVLWSLAATTLISTLLLAPAYRWSETLCDAVMPSHIMAIGIASVGTAVAVKVGEPKTIAARIVLLAVVGVATLAAFGLAAPQCLGSPFGQMDPVVRSVWYEQVVEGMPAWRQDPISGASMVIFPIVGMIGTGLALRRAKSPEMRRRWVVIMAVLLVTAVTGAMVRRAAGVSHVFALPGALYLVILVMRQIDVKYTVLARFSAMALTVFGFSPIMPVLAIAAVTTVKPLAGSHIPAARNCFSACALQKIAQLPPQTLLAGIDLGPQIISRTPHRSYGSGYHRLGGPMLETILFFRGSPDDGEAFMRYHGFRHILIAPHYAETERAMESAPNGMASRLIKGPLPNWLIEVPLNSPDLRLYRLRD